MIFDYWFRLLSLCLATFFVVHLAASLVAVSLAPVAIRAARRMRAQRGAAFLFSLRLMPFGAAVLAVMAICAPSYLLLEPVSGGEEFGFGCIAVAVFGAAIWALALRRSGRAVWTLVHWQRHWKRTARVELVTADLPPVLVLEESEPFLALAGVFRPMMVISRSVLETLTQEELLTALRHESAHKTSRDNLKRLVMLLTPDPLPRWNAFEHIEQAWSRCTEWAADDRAAAGDPDRSVSLAAALVHVARLSGAPVPSPLMTSLLADSRDLSDRVNRLLSDPPSSTAGRWLMFSMSTLATTSVVLVVLAASRPGALGWVHGALERLVH